MRLGGPVAYAGDPEAWAAEARRRGYSAVYFPSADADDSAVAAIVKSAEAAGLVIAEVGAWGNPLSPDEAVRSAALEKCRAQLALADRAGARCCVNIAGSRGVKWDGPHADDLTEATFDLVVESVRSILDAVKPTRTFYTLEPMPWMYPDSAESYLRLLRAVGRKQFGVHLDLVNLVCSPQLYFGNAALIRDCFAKLGPHVRSCHAKDILLGGELTVHLSEVRPGLGALDYAVLLQELDRLEPDMPLMLEHLKTDEEYRLAADYVRSVARRTGVQFR
ncbi:MAG: sugar phosphate isomerase/epimerase [Candidatus Brocadiia bacterium]|jgi:sugar phosphate isomerase/epimerase